MERRQFIKLAGLSLAGILLNCSPENASELKKKIKGEIIGVVHTPEVYPDIHAFESWLDFIAPAKISYLHAKDKISELARKKPGATVMIETPDESILNGKKTVDFFSVLSNFAKSKGLKVVSYGPANSFLRRLNAYGESIDIHNRYVGGKKLQLLKQTATKYNLPSLEKMDLTEVESRLNNLFEIMTDFLIKDVQIKKPDMIIAGILHSSEFLKWVKNYSDSTPIQTYDFRMSLFYPDLAPDQKKKFDEHRRRLTGEPYAIRTFDNKLRTFKRNYGAKR